MPIPPIQIGIAYTVQRSSGLRPLVGGAESHRVAQPDTPKACSRTARLSLGKAGESRR
jgi:hypothetical protein